MVARRSVVLFVVGFLGVAFLGVGCGLIKFFDDMIHKQVKEVSFAFVLHESGVSCIIVTPL